jgi:hypothetical protein
MPAYQIWIVWLVMAFATLIRFATTSTAQAFPDEFRTLNGMQNSVDNSAWGSAGIQLLRMSQGGYAEGRPGKASGKSATSWPLSSSPS